MLQVYTGDGKGKTTAALGLCLRASGAGLEVLYAQFLKDGKSSELSALRGIKGIKVYPGVPAEGFYPLLNEADRDQIKATQREKFFGIAEELRCKAYGLAVLDEVLCAVDMGIITERELTGFIEEFYEKCEMILTGGPLPPRLREKADYISEVRSVKHPYDKGQPARRGIEF